MSCITKLKNGSRFATAWRHFEKLVWRHNSPWLVRFSEIWLVDAKMNAAEIIWSKSKPKIEFQYGAHLFSESGSSKYFSRALRRLSKYGLQIDFDLLIWVTHPNPKPEVDLWFCAAILKTRYDVITALGWFALNKIGRPEQNRMPLTVAWQKSKLGVKFEPGGS